MFSAAMPPHIRKQLVNRLTPSVLVDTCFVALPDTEYISGFPMFLKGSHVPFVLLLARSLTLVFLFYVGANLSRVFKH